MASHRDASLGTERRIPTGCEDIGTRFSTERRIPLGCVVPVPENRNLLPKDSEQALSIHVTRLRRN